MKVVFFVSLIALVISNVNGQSRVFSTQKSLRCTNYGDPHLFPFIGEMETCGMCGNHVLIKNRWLTVTAEINYVNQTESRATFVNKINIAFFDQDGLLIATFGSENIERNCFTYNGPIGSSNHIRAFISSGSSTAYLYYRQVKMNVFIRKNKFGYSFGIYVPESLVTDSSGLCVGGCPPDQVLTIESIGSTQIKNRIGHATKVCKDRFRPIMTNSEMIHEDRFHLESRIEACIFDVAITGDDSFSFEHIREIKDESIAENEDEIIKLSSKSSFRNLAMKLNSNNQCLIDDCIDKPINYRGAHPKFGNYYLECDSNKVMVIKQCPINTVFSDNWCR